MAKSICHYKNHATRSTKFSELKEMIPKGKLAGSLGMNEEHWK